MQKKKIFFVWLLVFYMICSVSGCGKEEEDSLSKVSVSEKQNTKDTGETNKEEKNEKEEIIIVYVCGEVKKEGIVKLPSGSRVYEAIEMAGGMTENADASWLNQAEVLSDGAKIDVPDKEETKTMIPESSPKSQEESGASLVNLNQADKEMLMTLPGIGESKAESILEYRKEHGKFGSIEEIKEIPGIKDGVFQKIKDKITI